MARVRNGRQSILLAFWLALFCANASVATHGDYSGARMPQYSDYERSRDAPSVADEYRDHSPDAPASLDYKYDDEARDKSVVDPKVKHEIDEWENPQNNMQEDKQKTWPNEYVESESDQLDETVTKFRPKYQQSKKRPRLRNREKPNDSEYNRKYQNNDIRIVDQEMDVHGHYFNNDDLQKDRHLKKEELYKDTPRLEVKKNRNRYVHRKTTDKIIRRKVRDRFNKEDISELDIRKPQFDLDDIVKLKPGNLLDDGALVPKPIKFNTDYDYSDNVRFKSKDQINLPLRRNGAAVTEREPSENSEELDGRSLLPLRNKELQPDSDGSDFGIEKIRKPFQTKFNRKKLSDDDYIRKYLNTRLKQQESIKAELTKDIPDKTVKDLLPPPDFISDIDDVKAHLGTKLETNLKTVEDYKARDLEYEEKDIENETYLRKTAFPLGDLPRGSSTRDYRNHNILTRTRASYRRKGDSDSDIDNTTNPFIEIEASKSETTVVATMDIRVLTSSLAPKKLPTSSVSVNTEDEESEKNSSTELSLAEKSRLSVMKKVMRKESLSSKTTKKPPVLMQVTQGRNTMVMVEPPSTFDPWVRAKEVSGDTEERLKQVKRLMRHKLVSNAKNIRDLTENWDAMVCDYLDMSVLDNASTFRKGTFIAVAMSVISTLLMFDYPLIDDIII